MDAQEVQEVKQLALDEVEKVPERESFDKSADEKREDTIAEHDPHLVKNGRTKTLSTDEVADVESKRETLMTGRKNDGLYNQPADHFNEPNTTNMTEADGAAVTNLPHSATA